MFGSLENVREKVVEIYNLKFIVMVFLRNFVYFVEICKSKFIVVDLLTSIWLPKKLEENTKIQILNVAVFSATKHIKQRTNQR